MQAFVMLDESDPDSEGWNVGKQSRALATGGDDTDQVRATFVSRLTANSDWVIASMWVLHPSAWVRRMGKHSLSHFGADCPIWWPIWSLDNFARR